MDSVGGERNWFAELLRAHPALVVSGFYVFASLIGMLFAWSYLSRFGIDVFDYAQISDFLLASLKEPVTWGIATLSVLLMLGDNAVSRQVERHSTRRWLRWYGSPRYRAINVFAVLAVVTVLLNAYAAWKADRTRSGHVELVELRLNEGDVLTAHLLGTTASFVFAYEIDSERVSIYPHESIASITIAASAADRAEDN